MGLPSSCSQQQTPKPPVTSVAHSLRLRLVAANCMSPEALNCKCVLTETEAGRGCNFTVSSSFGLSGSSLHNNRKSHRRHVATMHVVMLQGLFDSVY